MIYEDNALGKLVEKYSNAEEMTPLMLNAFVEKFITPRKIDRFEYLAKFTADREQNKTK